MSGVIDLNGQQWERCNGCNDWIRIQRLGYLKPREGHNNGADLCLECTVTAIDIGSIKFDDIVPGKGWLQVEKCLWHCQQCGLEFVAEESKPGDIAVCPHCGD